MNISSKMLGALGAAGLALGALPGAALAEEDRKLGYSITLTGVSDYIFRGISFTEEDPAFQPYVEFTYGIAYLGIWGSNIEDPFDTYGPWEVDIYAGIRPVVGPVNFDLGVLYYSYGAKNTFSHSDLDYVEFKISATTSPITNLTLGVTGYYTPDQDFSIPETGTVEGAVAYALPTVWIFSPTISGLVGFSTSEDNQFYIGSAGTGFFLGDDEYAYWNAGIKLSVEKYFMDFRYWDTDIDAQTGFDGSLADERFVFSAGVVLP